MWNRHLVTLLVASLLSLGLSACHDNHEGPEPPALTFSIGGTVIGSTGTVILQNSDGSQLSVSTNGAFSFATQMTPGASYNVTVAVPPTSQSCAVSNGAGTVGTS